MIISGAALMYTQGDKEKLNLKSFYARRALTIYPMFWIAYIVAATFYVLRSGWLFGSRPWQLVFTVFGVDGYVANMHVSTFYMLGEWFLGFILIFYAVFPLLRIGVKKYPLIAAVVVGVLYVVTLLSGRTILQLPQDLLLTTRLPELVFGMYFVRYIKKVPHVVGAGSIVLLILQQWKEFLSGNLAVTIVGVSFFLMMVWICQLIGNKPWRVIQWSVNWVSKYSYAIFLTHHVIIVLMFGHFADYAQWQQTKLYGLFFLDCAIIAVTSVVLFYVEKYVVLGIRKVFE